MQIKTNIVSFNTTDSKPVKQEVNSTVILPPSDTSPFSIPWFIIFTSIKPQTNVTQIFTDVLKIVPNKLECLSMVGFFGPVNSVQVTIE